MARSADETLKNAVALAYSQTDAAPRVVAKGRGELALKIREVAKASAVPLLEAPPLAELASSKIGLSNTHPPAATSATRARRAR